MSKDFNFMCNRCGKKEAATWNGEHYLPQKGWIELVENTYAIGHLCPDCNPMNSKKEKSQ